MADDLAGLDRTRLLDVEPFGAGGTEVAFGMVSQSNFVIVPGLISADDIPGEILFGVTPIELPIVASVL